MTKHIICRLLWIALCLAMPVALSSWSISYAQQCPASGTIQGAITTGDPTQSGRLLRNFIPSECGGAKTFPGIASDTTPRHYDTYTFTNNSGAQACVRVTLSAPTCADPPNEIQSAAYSPSFDPRDISKNYLGDSGDSPSFTSSDVSYVITVPAGATFVIVVNEITANAGCGAYSLTLDCMATPVLAVGNVLISEFRLAGPGLPNADPNRDEFVELYNNTDAPIDVSGYNLENFDPNFLGPGEGSDFAQPLPSGSIIPPRGHLLVGHSSSYSLSAYAPLNFDTVSVIDVDFFIHDQGIRLISPGGSVVYDSVGFIGGGGFGAATEYIEGTGLPQLGTIPAVQWSWVRRTIIAAGAPRTGLPQDTNNNAADWVAVSVTGATFPGTSGGPVASVLGAPGPENLASPIQRNAQIRATLLDPMQSAAGSNNRFRNATPNQAVCNGNCPLGTLSIRRTYTNNTGQRISRLRFRIVDITTLHSPGYVACPDPNNCSQADLRALSSPDVPVTITGGSTITVRGLTLEQPPNQLSGGGLNSSLAAGTITTTTPLEPGAQISVQFLVGVQQRGSFSFFVNVEALPLETTLKFAQARKREVK